MTTLTASVKKRISADWLQEFPGLGLYKPLHLLRRVGPILEGIVLDRTRSNDLYRPTFHLHCLVREFPVVNMSIFHRLLREETGAPDFLTIKQHAGKYHEAADRLRRQSPLALEGNLSLDELLQAYRTGIKTGLHFDVARLYEEMALVCGWAGRAEQGVHLLDEAMESLKLWPENAISQIGGIEKWRDKVSRAVANQSLLQDIANEQTKSLGAEDLPSAGLDAGQ